MNHFESVVFEYLRADRALFVNTQCCIQVNEAANPDTSGPHWYCDAVAVDFRHKAIFLCEISYADGSNSLVKRVGEWKASWLGLRTALFRDSHLPKDWKDWPVQPWLFVPEALIPKLQERLGKLPPAQPGTLEMPHPRFTPLEEVVPWKYSSWNRSPIAQ